MIKDFLGKEIYANTSQVEPKIYSLQKHGNKFEEREMCMSFLETM